MDLVIKISLADSSARSLTVTDDSNSSSSSFVLVLQDKLKGANWSALAGIVRVLRNILKCLTPENDFELISVYLDSIGICLSNVPWDSFTEIFVDLDCDIQKRSVTEALFQRFMFLGSYVQFLCSLVEQSGSMEASDGSMNKHPVVLLTIDLVPKLFSWCPGKQGNCVNKCIFQYFRHKLLVWST